MGFKISFLIIVASIFTLLVNNTGAYDEDSKMVIFFVGFCGLVWGSYNFVKDFKKRD